MPIIAGPDTRVNTTTAANQAFQEVTALVGGGWVVTWLSLGQNDAGSGVYQQAYDADGTPQGGETLVNTFTTGDQAGQQVTALDSGGWVVTWVSSGQDGSAYGLYQQAYAANGTPQGGETQVNTFTTGDQGSQQVTALDSGGWVVTWMSSGQDGSNYGVYQQVYAANGTALGGETQVNTYTTSDQSFQQVTALDSGGWVVTWHSLGGQDGSDVGVYQRAYAANGTPQGGETLVNTFTTDYQSSPQIVALDGGGWVVTWQSYSQDGSAYGIYQQAYAANGTPQGAETHVSTFTTGDQREPYITALDDGGWVVTWRSFGQDGSDYGIYQQAYASNGAPVGGETQVNTFTANQQLAMQVTGLNGGGWVVIWHSANQDGDGYGVYQQAYAADGTPEGAEIQVNTFTASDQQYPQVSALEDGGWVVTWWSTGQDGAGLGVYQKTFHINDAPEGADATITIAEDTAHVFDAADFGFTDADGDALSAVIITTLPTNGKLTLDGALVVAGQSIAVADLDGLTWKPAKDSNGDALASLTFQVVAEGGNDDTDPTANTITFDVTEVIDRRIGGFRDDTLDGTDGDDILRGKEGDDILRGKAGDDSLRSIGGNDRFAGGTGADTFIFSTGSDRDTITDFETGIDRINLSRWKAIDDFADVKSHARNHGDDVWITAGHDTLVIIDTKKADLQAGDFVF